MYELNSKIPNSGQNKILSAGPSTLYDALQLLRQEGLEEISIIQSSVLRTYVPELGGPEVESGKHVSFLSLEFTKNVPIHQLADALLVQERYFERVGSSSTERRRHRCALKKLVQISLQRGFIPELQKLDNRPNFNQFHKPTGERRSTAIDVSSTGRKRPKSYALGTADHHYILFNNERVLANPKLNEELHQVYEYIKPFRKRESQAEAVIHLLRCILGWLHDVKGIPLSNLTLKSLIIVEQLRYSEKDFCEHPAFQRNSQGHIVDPNSAEQILANAEALGRRRAQRAAEELLKLLEEFFLYRQTELARDVDDNGLEPSTKQSFLVACILAAEYLYQDETQFPRRKAGCKKRRGDGFEDVAVITALRRKRGDYPIDKAQMKRKINNTRCLPWSVAIEVTRRQRSKALIRNLFHRDKDKKCGYQKKKRKESGIAHEMQKSLALLFMVSIPTDRQQTYRNLQLGSTLKNGYFVDDKADDFVDVELPLDPNQARLWINLNDFKTVEKFGEFWYPVPNLQFLDGTTFYQQIFSWIVGFEDKTGNWPNYYQGKDANWQGYIDAQGERLGWRAALKPEHEYLFTMPNARRPYNQNAFYSLIRQIFIHFTQEMGKTVGVSPHSLRHMLASYLDSLQISDAEKKSFSYVMHHSLETHERDYVHHKNQQLIQPAIERMEQILNHGFFTQ